MNAQKPVTRSLSGVHREHISALLGHAHEGVATRHYIARMFQPLRDAVLKLDLPDDVPFEV